MHRIQTFNTISEKGLKRFPADHYEVGADVDDAVAILLRSHKLDPGALKSQLKAIARAGAGVNNIPIIQDKRLSEAGGKGLFSKIGRAHV